MFDRGIAYAPIKHIFYRPGYYTRERKHFPFAGIISGLGIYGDAGNPLDNLITCRGVAIGQNPGRAARNES